MVKSKLRNALRAWLKYNHDHSHSDLKVHTKYCEIISELENFANMTIIEESSVDTWKKILEALATIQESDMRILHYKIKDKSFRKENKEQKSGIVSSDSSPYQFRQHFADIK